LFLVVNFLKCVVKQVALFSVDPFKTPHISEGSVATHVRCGRIVLLQIFFWFWQWNNFVNQLIFDKVTAYKTLCQFFGHPINSAVFPELTINTVQRTEGQTDRQDEYGIASISKLKRLTLDVRRGLKLAMIIM